MENFKRNVISCFAGQHNGFLLGDSGYPCRRFLMTPILHPVTPSENRFNESLCRTRVLIEQTFGILKRRFQCLHAELRTSPPNAVTYVIACVVLHNIGIERGDIIDLDADDMTPPNDVPFVNVHVPGQNDGTMMRDHIVTHFFLNINKWRSTQLL